MPFGTRTSTGLSIPSQVGEDQGIVRSILDTFKDDFVGAGRTLVGGTGSALELLGANVPFTIEDLEGRDVKGFAMLASMLVAGAAPGILAKVLPQTARFIQPLQQGGSAIARLKNTAVREAVAGAAFGLTRTAIDPAEDEALKNALGDAALFGAFGGGFSLVGSATRATFNAFQGVNAAVKSAQQVQAQGQMQSLVLKLQEFAGFGMKNEAGDIAVIARDDVTNEITTQFFSAGLDGTLKQGTRTAPAQKDFGRALAALVQKGYTERLGTFQQRFKKLSGESLDELAERGLVEREGLESLREGLKGVNTLREVEFSEFKGFYKAGAQRAQVKVQTEKLVQDVLAQTDEFGVPLYDRIGTGGKDLKAIAREIVGAPKRWFVNGELAVNSDRVRTEVMEAAIEQGVISFHKMTLSMGLDEIARWLPLGLVPKGFIPQPNPQISNIMLKILSGSTIRKRFPSIGNWLDESGLRQETVEHLNRNIGDRLFAMREEIEGLGVFGAQEQSLLRGTFDKAAGRAINSLDQISGVQVTVREQPLNFSKAYEKLSELLRSGEATEAERELLSSLNARWVERANGFVQNSLKQRGPQMVRAGELFTEFFTEHLGLMQESGQLAMGRPGYFPIFNEGSWVATITNRKGKREVLGFVDSASKAEKMIQERISSGEALQGAIRPGTSFYQGRGSAFRPKDWKAMQDLEASLNIGNVQRDAGAIFGQRTLGFRDWEKLDVWSAMDIYGRSVNKRLGFGQLPQSLVAKDPVLQQFLAANSPEAMQSMLSSSYFSSSEAQLAKIPDALNPLRNWVGTLRDDILGVPRGAEVAIDTMLQNFGVAPGKARRYLGFMRSIENVFRLGGIGSSAVQVTQLLTNVPTELGLGATVGGIAKFLGGAKGWSRKEIVDLMAEHGVSPQFIASFAGDVRSKEFRRMVKGLMNQGGMKELGKAFNKEAAWDATQSLFLMPFMTSEQINRMITFKVAFEKFVGQGKRTAEAGKLARESMFKTQFNYHISDMPEFLRSPVGATLFQFKSFFIKEMEFIAGLSGKQQLQLATLVSSLGGVGTLLNVPGPDLANAAAGLFYDRTIDEDLKIDGLSEFGVERGSATERFILYGLPGVRNRINMSDRISIGGFSDLLDFWASPALSDTQAFASFLAKAIPQIASTGSVGEETLNRFVQKVVPTDMRRASLVNQLQNGEVRQFSAGQIPNIIGLLPGVDDPIPNTSTKMIYKSMPRLSNFLTFAGPPIELSEEQAADRVLTRTIDRYRKNYTNFAREAASARLAGDQELSQSILGEARGAGYNVTPQSLRYHLEDLQLPASERRRRRTPGALRDEEDLQSLFDATGSIR